MAAKLNDWSQCLAVPIVAEPDAIWRDYWDYNLGIVASLDRWEPDQYTPATHNCYSFVLTFLRSLQVKDLKPSLTTKTQFCKDFIVPRTKNAAKYIALYRKVIKEGVTVIRSPGETSNPSSAKSSPSSSPSNSSTSSPTTRKHHGLTRSSSSPSASP